jgi:hypothetical protein
VILGQCGRERDDIRGTTKQPILALEPVRRNEAHMDERPHMDELIARVSSATGMERETASKAVGLVLAFLRKEGPPQDVDALFAELPGAAEAAAAADSSGGSLFGGLMGLAGKLGALGLGMGEMQALGKELFGYVKEKAGEERVGQIAAAIPGLAQLL